MKAQDITCLTAMNYCGTLLSLFSLLLELFIQLGVS